MQIKFVKEIPIINGTYKKDTPNKDIGYQKWQVRKTYEVDMWNPRPSGLCRAHCVVTECPHNGRT